MNTEYNVSELSSEEVRDIEGGTLPIGPIMLPVIIVKWICDQLSK